MCSEGRSAAVSPALLDRVLLSLSSQLCLCQPVSTVQLAHGQQFLCLCTVVYNVRSICVGPNIFPVLLHCNGNVILLGADSGPIQTYLKSYCDMFFVFYLIR